jgi:hypothetical protein
MVVVNASDPSLNGPSRPNITIPVIVGRRLSLGVPGFEGEVEVEAEGEVEVEAGSPTACGYACGGQLRPMGPRSLDVNLTTVRAHCRAKGVDPFGDTGCGATGGRGGSTWHCVRTRL